MKISRRNFLLAGGVTVSGTAAAAAYPVYVEPRLYEVRRTRIASKWLAPGNRVRIVQLSDIHAGPGMSYEAIAEVFQLAAAEKPDLICLTGDYITRKVTKSIDGYREVLELLPKVAPVYATLGNHDGGLWAGGKDGYGTSSVMIDLLESAGIWVLHNKNTELEVHGQRLTLIGLGDLWSREFDFHQAFQGLPKLADGPRVVLSHNPDTKDILIYGDWDLLLSGHTHGGQIRFPGFAPPVLPVTDRRFFDGLYQWKGRTIYVNRGVGGIYGGVRFNCRPEIGVLDLVPAALPHVSSR